MNLTLSLVAAAIGWVGESVRLPVTDKLAIEIELLRMHRCRPVGGQYAARLDARLSRSIYGLTRVYCVIQFTSQVLPPSAEKACSERASSAVTSQMEKRTSTALPLIVS